MTGLKHRSKNLRCGKTKGNLKPAVYFLPLQMKEADGEEEDRQNLTTLLVSFQYK